MRKGKINVNDPISKYIEGNDRGDDITIHNLLTHTSGLSKDGMFLAKLKLMGISVNFLSIHTLRE